VTENNEIEFEEKGEDADNKEICRRQGNFTTIRWMENSSMPFARVFGLRRGKSKLKSQIRLTEVAFAGGEKGGGGTDNSGRTQMRRI